jgi:hypothetical protein
MISFSTPDLVCLGLETEFAVAVVSRSFLRLSPHV